jgi:hypothetical protein
MKHIRTSVKEADDPNCGQNDPCNYHEITEVVFYIFQNKTKGDQ